MCIRDSGAPTGTRTQVSAGRRPPRRPGSGGADEVDDHLGQFGPPVLLEEVTATGDGGVVTAGGTGDPCLQSSVRAGGDGITVAERGEERLVEPAEHLPRRTVGRCRRVVGRDGDQRGELASALAVGVVGEGGVVGGDDLGGQVGGAPGVDDDAGGEWVHLLGEREPGQERLTRDGIAGGEVGVGRYDPGEPVRVLGNQPQPDEAAPVLADQGHLGQLEVVEEEAPHPLHVAGEGVLGARCRFVRAAEAHEVGCDDPQTASGERRDHVTVEVAPRRLAVEQEHDRAVSRAFVEVVDPPGAAVLIVNDCVVGLEGEAGQRLEAVVGGSEDFHRGGHLLSGTDLSGPGCPVPSSDRTAVPTITVAIASTSGGQSVALARRLNGQRVQRRAFLTKSSVPCPTASFVPPYQLPRRCRRIAAGPSAVPRAAACQRSAWWKRTSPRSAYRAISPGTRSNPGGMPSVPPRWLRGTRRRKPFARVVEDVRCMARVEFGVDQATLGPDQLCLHVEHGGLVEDAPKSGVPVCVEELDQLVDLTAGEDTGCSCAHPGPSRCALRQGESTVESYVVLWGCMRAPATSAPPTLGCRHPRGLAIGNGAGARGTVKCGHLCLWDTHHFTWYPLHPTSSSRSFGMATKVVRSAAPGLMGLPIV